MKQRYIASENYGSSHRARYSFVVIEVIGVGEGEKNTEYWVCQVRLLFHHNVNGVRKQYAFVTYMESVESFDELEDCLRCAMLQWTTDDDVDYTINGNLFDDRNPPSPWYGIIETSHIKSVVQLIRMHYDIKQKKDGGHWSIQTYVFNRFMCVDSSCTY